MATFLSPVQKQNIDVSLDRLHDTFAKNIFVYIEKEKDVSSDASYNALYSASSVDVSTSYSKILTRHAISARVKYFSNQAEGKIANNLPDSKGLIRLKVRPDDYELIKICTKVEVDNLMYLVDGDASIEGMFSNNYYSVHLKREN